MQVGELVELSAAGRKIKQNSQCYGLIGLIVRIEKDGNITNHPIKIQWLITAGELYYPMKRYEIKRVRGTK